MMLAVFMFWLMPSLSCVVFSLLLITSAMVIVFSQESLPLHIIVRYVMLQEVGTCLFALGWVVGMSDLQAIGLLIKLGLPPFHSWLLECSFGISSSSLWCLLVSSKFLPMSLLVIVANWLWGVLFVVVGSLAVYACHTVINLLVVSSWLMTGWMVMSSGYFMLMTSLVIYTASMGSVVSIVSNHINELGPSPVSWINLLMLVGLPFSSMFLIKMYLLSEVSMMFSGPLMMILMMATVLSSVGYYHVYSMQVQMNKLLLVSINSQNMLLSCISWLFGLILITFSI